MLDECASRWQATEKPVLLSDECADRWLTSEKSVRGLMLSFLMQKLG